MKLTYILIASIASFTKAGSKTHRVQLSESGQVELMSEEQVLNMIKKDIHFFDLSNQTNVRSIQSRKLSPLPSKLNYNETVKSAHQNINIKEMTSFIKKFSAFPNRYYANPNGAKASTFLLNHIKRLGEGFKSKFTVGFFKHAWIQPSIIARLEGTESPDEIVIVGAHLDSINKDDPMNGIAPGADDNGSGVASVLGALHSLAKSEFSSRRTIEFQFYAAEEVGLRGSQEIANTYAKERKDVVGMLQLDMTGYNVNKRVSLVTDFTDPELTQFLRNLIDTYGTYKWFDDKCGYACSDHASFTKAGFRSAHPFEDADNKHIHTSSDTMEFVDMSHVAEFSRLAISFIVELAFPASA